MHFHRLLNPVDIDEEDFPNIKILHGFKKVTRLNTFLRDSRNSTLNLNMSFAPSWFKQTKRESSKLQYGGSIYDPEP
jgi:hypothetical protein